MAFYYFNLLFKTTFSYLRESELVYPQILTLHRYFHRKTNINFCLIADLYIFIN
jgi:hypothetical protein